MRVTLAQPDRRPPARDAHRDQCSFCLRARAEVDALVVAPAVSICPACALAIAEGARTLGDPGRAAREGNADGGASIYRSDARVCSFCAHAPREETVFAEHACICVPCVRLAMEVLIEETIETPHHEKLHHALRALDPT